MVDIPGSVFDKVKMRSQSDVNPVVDDVDVEDIIAGHAVRDRHGNHPSDDGWVPTFDVARSVRDVWELKAGLSANMADFNIDGGSVERSQVFQHCKEMAEHWASQCKPKVWR